jgi:hypothetical protein
MLEIRGNMEQCKSKDQDCKSYANAVFRSGCCCLSASLSTKTLKANMGQCRSEGQYFKRIKENMGQSESKERDLKE